MNQQPPPSSEPAKEDRATHWLSQGFETLVASLEGDPNRTAASIDFDVVIVGTGYGGSVAAAELAKTRGKQKRLRAGAWRRASARVVSVADGGTAQGMCASRRKDRTIHAAGVRASSTCASAMTCAHWSPTG